MGQADEQGLVQQFVAHAAVEALHVAVLHRSARSDVMPLHADLPAPCQHGIAGELRAVVADDHTGLAAPGDQLGQLAHDTAPRDRGVRHRCQALPGHVIDYVEHAEPATRRHLVMDKVQAPALVRQRQHRSRCSGPHGSPAAAPPPDCQSFLLIEPLGLLAVDHHALPAQQDMQTAIAEPATLVGQLAQLLTQASIIVPGGTVTHALAIGIDDTARPPLAHPVAGLEMSYSFPHGGGRQNFFASRSFNATLSSIVSASSRLSFAFSLSSSLSRRASDTSSPPYFDFQL